VYKIKITNCKIPAYEGMTPQNIIIPDEAPAEFRNLVLAFSNKRKISAYAGMIAMRYGNVSYVKLIDKHGL
jgi:hypothetical protein